MPEEEEASPGPLSYLALLTGSPSRSLSSSSTMDCRQSDMRTAWRDTTVIHCSSPECIRYSKLSSRSTLDG